MTSGRMLTLLILVALLSKGLAQEYFDLYGSENDENVVPEENNVREPARTNTAQTIIAPTPAPTPSTSTVTKGSLPTKIVNGSVATSTVFPALGSNITALAGKSAAGTSAPPPVMSPYVTIAVVCSIVIFIVLVGCTIRIMKRLKQLRLREDLAMTNRDARLSSTFLQDIPTSGRSVKMESFVIPIPNPVDTVVIDVVTANSPVPSEISLTTPRGTKKPIWKSYKKERSLSSNFIKIKMDETCISDSLKPSISNPSLVFDENPKHIAERHNYVRRFALLLSDEEDVIDKLKKPKRKRWRRKKTG